MYIFLIHHSHTKLKLLKVALSFGHTFLDYSDIYEPVIVENPFTQVTACGEGLRQYHIGLTRFKIIFACDDFDFVDIEDFSYKGADPEIETFQLVSMMPLQFLQFDFYRKKDRNIMRICVAGEEKRPMLFEVGGHLFKSFFWKTWRECVATIKPIHPHHLYIPTTSTLSSDNVVTEDEHYYVETQSDFYNSQLSWRSYATNCSLMSH